MKTFLFIVALCLLTPPMQSQTLFSRSVAFRGAASAQGRQIQVMMDRSLKNYTHTHQYMGEMVYINE